jgi:glycine cleavage system regulatory protein
MSAVKLSVRLALHAGGQLASSDIAMLEERLSKTVSLAVTENIAPVSKMVAKHQLRLFVPVASYANSHQERNSKLKDYAIVVSANTSTCFV